MNYLISLILVCFFLPFPSHCNNPNFGIVVKKSQLKAFKNILVNRVLEETAKSYKILNFRETIEGFEVETQNLELHLDHVFKNQTKLIYKPESSNIKIKGAHFSLSGSGEVITSVKLLNKETRLNISIEIRDAGIEFPIHIKATRHSKLQALVNKTEMELFLNESNLNIEIKGGVLGDVLNSFVSTFKVHFVEDLRRRIMNKLPMDINSVLEDFLDHFAKDECDEDLILSYNVTQYNVGKQYHTILGNAFSGTAYLSQPLCEPDPLPLQHTHIANNNCTKAVIIILDKCYLKAVLHETFPSLLLDNFNFYSEVSIQEPQTLSIIRAEFNIKTENENSDYTAENENSNSTAENEKNKFTAEMKGNFEFEEEFLLFNVTDMTVHIPLNFLDFIDLGDMERELTLHPTKDELAELNFVVPLPKHDDFKMINPQAYFYNGFLQICTDITDIQI